MNIPLVGQGAVLPHRTLEGVSLKWLSRGAVLGGRVKVDPLLGWGAINSNTSLPPTLNYAGIQDKKFEISQ